MTHTRREALGLLGMLALAGCSIKGQRAAAPKQDDIQRYWASKTKGDHVNFANWADYMDPKHTPLKQFTEQTGVSVTYRETITEDAPWFGKIQPLLAANKSIGYDLMVVTNGIEFTKMVELGYLAPLDHSKMPNFAKYAAPTYKNEAFDPGNRYSVPYVSGITGIAYNPKYVKEPVTGIADLWNPKYKGKVGMMTDVQEVGNFAMFLNGVDPEKSTRADWTAAAAKLKQQRDSGIVRKYYDQDYVKALDNGDVWLTMAWSGDIFQENVSNGTNLQFVIPKEGGTIWTDNLMIPKTASNPLGALMLIDFFYRPDIAARLAEFVNYVTPVPSARDIIAKDALTAKGDDKATYEALVKSPLVFPSDADYAKLRRFRSLNNTEEPQYQSVFQPIVAG